MTRFASLMRRLAFYAGFLATHAGLAGAGFCLIALYDLTSVLPVDDARGLFGQCLVVAVIGMAAMDLAVRLPRFFPRLH